MGLMVPSVLQDNAAIRSNIRLRDYAEYLDGMILQGGADVSPLAYGEEPLRPEWSGDPVRDAYELELPDRTKVQACFDITDILGKW